MGGGDFVGEVIKGVVALEKLNLDRIGDGGRPAFMCHLAHRKIGRGFVDSGMWGEKPLKYC